MENANRPNGVRVPEEPGCIIRRPDGTVRVIPKPDEDEDIRVSLGSIRKEIEETNRILRRIEQGLGGKR